MAIVLLGGASGIVADVNVVPLIDVLLVLLVIFMIIPHRQNIDTLTTRNRKNRAVTSHL